MKTRGFVRWSSTNKLDTKYEPQWYIEIAISKDDKRLLEDVGLKIRAVIDEDDNVIYTFKATRREARMRGKKIIGVNPPPIVVDKDLNKFDGIIGRGSEVIVIHKPWGWSNGKGMSSDLQKIQVINLVPYEREDTGDDDLRIEGDTTTQKGVLRVPDIEEELTPYRKEMGDDVPF